MCEVEFLVCPYENISEVSNFCHPLLLIDTLHFNSQDLFSNSPYCLLYNSSDVTSENLVLDQLIIP